MRFLFLVMIVFLSTNSFSAGPFKWRRPATGCLAKDSRILFANGSYKKISNVNGGEILVSGNENDVKVLVSFVGPEKNMIKMTLSSGKFVIATIDHPFVTSEDSFIALEDIKVDTKLKTINGIEKVMKLEKVLYNDQVYNVYLADIDIIKNDRLPGDSGNWKKDAIKKDPFLGLNSKDHTFFVNGILSGDWLIQKALID